MRKPHTCFSDFKQYVWRVSLGTLLVLLPQGNPDFSIWDGACKLNPSYSFVFTTISSLQRYLSQFLRWLCHLKFLFLGVICCISQLLLHNKALLKTGWLIIIVIYFFSCAWGSAVVWLTGMGSAGQLCFMLQEMRGRNENPGLLILLLSSLLLVSPTLH